MEILNEIAKQSLLVAFAIAVIMWLLSDRKEMKKEIKILQDLVMAQSHDQTEREKEISDEKREDLEATLNNINSQVNAIKNQTDAIKELANQVRYDRK
jgi:uncharacterized protein YlxW (UPF0749 family)